MPQPEINHQRSPKVLVKAKVKEVDKEKNLNEQPSLMRLFLSQLQSTHNLEANKMSFRLATMSQVQQISTCSTSGKLDAIITMLSEQKIPLTFALPQRPAMEETRASAIAANLTLTKQSEPNMPTEDSGTQNAYENTLTHPVP